MILDKETIEELPKIIMDEDLQTAEEVLDLIENLLHGKWEEFYTIK